jgi:NAD-dependent SIR2 family protein deacetylase
MDPLHEAAVAAAAWIEAADALMLTAGAGMGVDSGLPDFRGPQGFWRAYPALGRRGISFEEAASPATFTHDPALAWGFYGHRLSLYRRTVPHAGFAMLLDIGAQLTHGVFVFTSNVDGQFQRAGFPADRVCEVHGSIHHLQCLNGCTGSIWPADNFDPDVDEGACELRGEPPRCPDCGTIARPNILMFGDWGWIDDRTRAQHDRLETWLRGVRRPVVLELGAGTRIPSARRFGERISGPLVRINPTESEVPGGTGVGLRTGALHGVRLIHETLRQR